MSRYHAQSAASSARDLRSRRSRRSGMGAAVPGDGGGGEDPGLYDQAKAKIEEAHDKFVELIQKRQQTYDAISKMAQGQARDNAVVEFNDAEGFVTNYIFPSIKQLFEMIGYPTPSTDLPGTLGFLPLIIGGVAVAVPWAVVIAAGAIAATALGYIITSLARYTTILARPEVAQYDKGEGFLSNLGGGVGDTIKYAAIGIVLVFAISTLLPVLRKSK